MARSWQKITTKGKAIGEKVSMNISQKSGVDTEARSARPPGSAVAHVTEHLLCYSLGCRHTELWEHIRQGPLHSPSDRVAKRCATPENVIRMFVSNDRGASRL